MRFRRVLPGPLRAELEETGQAFLEKADLGEVVLPSGEVVSFSEGARPVVRILLGLGARLGWEHAVEYYELGGCDEGRGGDH